MPAPVEDGRLVRVGHRLLPLDGLTLGAMTPTPPTLLQTDPAAARERLARDGYLLLRGVLPAATVERACAATCAVLAEAGWLAPGSDPEKRIAHPEHASPELELRMNGYSISGPGLADKGSSMRAGAAGGQMYGKYHELYNHPDMRAVLHSQELFDVAAALFGEAAGALDYRWMRAVLPDMLVGHGYHMDNVYMGRGSDRLHTFWLPLHHIDIETGGVVLVEGSSSRPGFARLRETFGMQEQLVTLGQDPAELTAMDPGARWVTYEYEPGDLVVFGMHTLHGGVTNSTDTVRLSIDSRFQPLADPHDPRFPLHGYGPTPPFSGEEFIEQQASQDRQIGPRDEQKFEGLDEAKAAWGVAAAPLALRPDPTNPPPKL